MQSPGTLELIDTMSGLRYALHGKRLRGGDLIATCFSGGWVVGQYAWNSDPAERPRFRCSMELAVGEA
ncbi:MAG TPA: hypothetical protein VIV60_10675 [Polyangiaceae bacterium]